VSGAIAWVTGLPSAGKSTLARRLREGLAAAGAPALVLDGDEVRESLVPAPGHLPAERDAFYETLARLAALAARQGLVVVVAATSHRRAHRERARALFPRVVEIWVRTPPEECERRDARGLWALHRAGKAPLLPGPGVPYETPAAPDVVAAGGEDREALEAALALLVRRG
jgi:adenylylsulfate kinase